MKALLRICAAVARPFAVGLVLAVMVCKTSSIMGFSLAPPAYAEVVAAPASPTATQNTITTTGPVASETTISVGTLAGQALNWIAVVFAGPIGGMVVWILVRVLKKLGIDATDALRARLQEMVVNGLNVSAKAAQTELVDKGTIAIKSAVVADAVNYVQVHGADTLKQLGVDPYSNVAIDAIKARIETAIADPATPTPAVLDPVTPPPSKGIL